MAQQEELVLWIDRRWKNAIEKHLNGETLQEYWTSCVISFQRESMSASAMRFSRKLPHGGQRKKRPALMPPTM